MSAGPPTEELRLPGGSDACSEQAASVGDARGPCLGRSVNPCPGERVRVHAIDHLVLTVRDLEATLEFYTQVLGAEAITFGAGRHALVIGAQKLNLHVAGQEFAPKAAVPTPGSADLCLLTSSDPAHVVAHLAACGVTVVEGPVVRTGAQGPIRSVYCRDPDGNLIEISSYLPGA